MLTETISKTVWPNLQAHIGRAKATVGSFDLSPALARDDYGNCIISPTVNDIEQSPVLAPGRGDIAAVIEMEDGSTISVRGKKCTALTPTGTALVINQLVRP